MNANSEEQPADVPEASATPSETSAEKKPRNPVEKMLVWGFIAVGLVVVAIEARAKLGYDMTLSGLSQKTKEIDESDDGTLALDEETVQAYLKFGPQLGEEEPAGNLRKARWIGWYSLAKPDAYRLKLIFDEDGTFLFVETTDPPEPPEPEVGDETDEGGEHDAEGGFPGGGGPAPGGMAGGGGGPGAGAGGGRGGGRRNGLLGLLGIEEVATEINLTDDQKSKVEEFAETIQAESGGMREIFGQMREASEEERDKLRAQITSMRTEIEQKVIDGLATMLDEGQVIRLMQIEWQRQGTTSLTTDVVAEKLMLTEEQQQKLNELGESRRGEMSELGREGSPADRQAIADKYDAEFASVLSEEQKTLWEELQGEKFDLPEPQRGGGGRGGPGGGGGNRPERPQRPEAE